MDRQRIIDKLSATKLTVGKDTYRVERELGRGGNGVTFLCNSSGSRQVVVKVYIPPDSRDLDDRALERFENEIAITSKIKHPNIVPSLGASSIEFGTYKLPLYLMPVAAGTLRNAIRLDTEPDDIEKKLRLFLRAAYGVACLHHHGIIHRDLKPENILLSKAGVPWVADLGIAHVNPDFVSVGLKTVANERLRNADYYAPEQRFGSATRVDHRADIYALGCILYELLTSIPPVRTNAPNPSTVSSAFAPFDLLWQRMTAWEPEMRYQTIEDALEDFSISLGWVLASLRGAAGLRHPDLDTMSKLLKSSNEAHRRQGVDIAGRLGRAALAELHSLMGHGKRDVRNSCARALGRIGDEASVPFLVAALYGNTEKAGHFRPAADTAADALAGYSDDRRLHSLSLVEHPIRPGQVLTILRGIGVPAAYDSVVRLKERGLLLLDYGETELAVLAAIDENRAWPEIQALIDGGNDFRIRHMVSAHLSPSHKTTLVKEWVERAEQDKWYFRFQAEAVVGLECDASEKVSLLDRVEAKILAVTGRFEERDKLLRQVRAAKRTLDSC